jgi:sec-independent protein translocase protein TatA
MFGIGAPELLIILFIVLLLFGARKLPGLANSLGGSIAEFKKGMKGGASDDTKTIDAAKVEPQGEVVPKASEPARK